MRKYVLQMLFIFAAFLVFPGCSDDEDNVDWGKVVKVAVATPSSVYFERKAELPDTVKIDLAFSVPVPEDINFEVRLAADNEVCADSISFSHDYFTIRKGERSFEIDCKIKAGAVEKGVRNLRMDFVSTHAEVGTIRLEIPVEKEGPNTIVHVKDLNWVVDFDQRTWQEVEAGGILIGGLFQTTVAIGSAPAEKRIHFDNYGRDIMGVKEGDLIHILSLSEGTEIEETSNWTFNSSYSDENWMYMPVLYSENYTDWLGKTAYVGMRIVTGEEDIVFRYYWFKFTVTDDAVFTLTEYAYDKEGKSLRAGQTESENKQDE